MCHWQCFCGLDFSQFLEEAIAWPWSYDREPQSSMAMMRDEGLAFPCPCRLPPPNNQPLLTANAMHPGLSRGALKMLTAQPEPLVSLGLMLELGSHLL